MKRSLVALLAAPLVLHAGENPAKLEAEPLSRYQAMLDRSPFALATEAAPPPVAAENVGFTKDLVLTGAVRFNDGEYVTVASKDQTQRFSLRTGETYNEISLVNVAWSDAVGKTRAMLKKGAEYGTIGFDEATLRAAPAPGNNGEGVPPRSVPGPPVLLPQPAPGAPGARPPNPVVRRVRPIRAVPGR